jgi:hypothetical protein
MDCLEKKYRAARADGLWEIAPRAMRRFESVGNYFQSCLILIKVLLAYGVWSDCAPMEDANAKEDFSRRG